MILHRLTLAGPYAFPNEITLDFDAMESLIAVSGPNGAGKSTIFDAIAAVFCGEMSGRPGALFRNFATKGVIRLVWGLGEDCYESILHVDPGTQRSEGSLYEYAHAHDERGPLIAGPLIRDYKKAVQQIVGPIELLLAAMYAVQSGAGSFLKASRVERKALLTDLLGLHRFPVLHERAKQRQEDENTEYEIMRARIADLTLRAAEKAGLEGQRQEMAERLGKAQERLLLAEKAVSEAMEARDGARAQRAELEPLRAKVKALDDEVAALVKRAGVSTMKMAECSYLLKSADVIRDAVTQATTLRGEIDTLDGQIAQAREAHTVALKASHEAQVARQAVEWRLGTKSVEHGNLTRQVAILDTVPCHGAGKYAGCTFLKDARAAGESLPAVTAEVTAARDALGTTPVGPEITDGSAALVISRARRVAKWNDLQPLVQQAPGLDAARARLDEVEAALSHLRDEMDRKDEERAQATERLKALPLVEATVNIAQVAVDLATNVRNEAQGFIQAASVALGRIEGQLESVLAAEVEAEDLTARLAPLALDCSEWALLTRALSPSGIPALLIDQALPEVGRLATELLRECFGESVFSIALTTQRESANGDKLLETLDVVVTRGSEVIDAALLSGGESVLVSESLALAIALYSATRSGRRIHTLLRDEVGAALDIARGPAYVRMLRRAVTLGSFHHVLYVSHMPACIDLADAQIEVRDGKVEVA